MVENLLEIQISKFDSLNLEVKVSGSSEAHYAPNAKVSLNTIPQPGDGFIALEEIPTPTGAIRLGSPKDNYDYAQILYSALRLADSKGIRTVSVIPPVEQGIGLAINNRILKASIDR